MCTVPAAAAAATWRRAHLIPPRWDSHDPPAPAHGWGYCQRSKSYCRYKARLKIAFSRQHLACRLCWRARCDALLQALRCNGWLVSQPPCTSLWTDFSFILYKMVHDCQIMPDIMTASMPKPQGKYKHTSARRSRLHPIHLAARVLAN